jgi:aminopeptidase N
MIHPAKRISLVLIALQLTILTGRAQNEKPSFTHADTLRGFMNPEREYNVLKYDITVTPDFDTKSIRGRNKITYAEEGNIRDIKDTRPFSDGIIQIDLQEPLEIDSIIQDNQKITFSREKNVFHVNTHNESYTKKSALENCRNCIREIIIYYHGNPHIAVNPPWDGGFIFTKDSLGRPWMSVACEGTGASVWYPCKDYLGDEPDSGATLTIIVPDSLVAVGNGRLISKFPEARGLTGWTWAVVNPINNYNIVPYIGKYVNWRKTFYGQKGNLDCSFWVLDYDLKKSKKHFTVVDSMLSCFEYWFGPYPFYEDGYKLVQSSYPGMEHQSNIAYGNHFMEGFLGDDVSGTGWGLKWDYMIVHESGHEWFGNNITCKDVADEWIHESFTTYSEILYTGNYFGKKAGDEYCIGTRKNILNLKPIIQYYGVNREPEGNDQYFKGCNMIHNIRQVIHDDAVFRKILHGLNQNFYHHTVTAMDIQNYINKVSGIDFTPVFDQYLRSKSVPVLEYKFDGKYLSYRWADCNPDFNMPILVDVNGARWLRPTKEWKKEKISMINPALQIDKNFYVLQRKVE